MRTFAILAALAACGGGSKPAAPQAPLPTLAPVAEATPPPAPAPEPMTPPETKPEPPPPAKKAVQDRLHDEAGELAGMPGWNVKRVVDRTVCGGARIVISKGKRKLDADQAALAKVYALAFPTDLNFDPANKKGVEAARKKFDGFVETLKKVSQEATTKFEKSLAGEPAAKAAATTRIAMVSLRAASLLVRAPIPKDVRTGDSVAEKTDAYCSKMEEVAEPLVARAEQALEACATLGAPDGWYTALCATTP